MKFFRELLSELKFNGKSLVAWLMNEVPGLTSYPGLIDALNAVASDPTNRSYIINLAFQLLWAGASGHRFAKIIAAVLKRS